MADTTRLSPHGRIARIATWLVPIAGGVAITSLFILAAVFSSGVYGAPLAFGQCPDDFIYGSIDCTFSWPVFVADILVTGSVIRIASWRSGPLGALLASAAALVTLWLLPWTGPVDLFRRWLAAMVIAVFVGAFFARLARQQPPKYEV